MTAEARGDDARELEKRILELERRTRRLELDLQHAEEAADWSANVVRQAHERIGSDEEERREVAGRLRDALVQAQQATVSKGVFLANMSHELRTPMTAILGFADLLLTSASDEATVIDCAQTIRRNGEHLLRIVDDILDLSKLDNDESAIERVRFSPLAVLMDVRDSLRPRAEDKGLELSIECSSPVPETVLSDPARLRQVLRNLVGNAIKFTERGWVRVAIDCDPPDRHRPLIRFRVEDTGIGMSPEQIVEVFEPFQQADPSTTRRFGGTGLGLPISKRYAEMLGGDISVESTRGRGSALTVSISTGVLAGIPMLWPRGEAIA